MTIFLTIGTLPAPPRHSVSLRFNKTGLTFKTLPIPCGKFESFYLSKATEAVRAALPIPKNSGMAASIWEVCQVLTCSLMLMHAIAHGGCTDTVRVCTES